MKTGRQKERQKERHLVRLFMVFVFIQKKFNTYFTGICISLFIIFIASDYLIPDTVSSAITICPQITRNEKSNASEIWLTDIFIDGKEQDLSKYLISKNWEYQEENNDLFYTANASEEEGNLVLEFPPAKKITLIFAMHSWCGKISIKETDILTEKDLYSEDYNIYEYVLQSNIVDHMQWNYILRSMIIFIILSIIIIFFLFRYKKIIDRYISYFCAFVHFGISIKMDAVLAFEINEYTIEYIIIKIIFGILLLCFWNFIFYLFREAREGNRWIQAGIKFFIIYWMLMSLIMLCIWPGNWLWDDIFIYEDAVCLRFTPWQHILSSVFYILSLMIIPIPAGIVICQYTIISGIVAIILTACYKRFRSKKLIYFMYIPFLLFPVLAHNFYPLRLSLYTFLELLFLFQFYDDSETSIKDSKTFWIGIIIINIILATWRSEGIFFLFLGPVLAFYRIRRASGKKGIVIYSGIVLAGVLTINSIQNTYIGEKKDYYGLTAYIESLDDLIKYEYREDPDSLLLNQMSDKVDLETIISVPSGEEAFWDGAYAGISTPDDYKMMKEIYVSLLKEHPFPWLKERILTFLTTSACTRYSRAFTGNSSEITVPEFVEDYVLTKPINNTIRNCVLNLLSGRTASMDGVNFIYRIFYNIIPSIVICFAGLLIYLKKRNFKKGLCYFTLVLHFALVFVAAPGVYFMYYLPVYLCGYTFFVYECADWKTGKLSLS